jgi:hypothetical protein
MAANPVPPTPHPFLFDHIPKSGGTFFREALIQVFGADEVSPLFDCGPGFPAQHPETITEFDRFHVVFGHLRLETRAAFLKLRPRFTLGLVRDPITIVASTYTYWRHNLPPGNALCDLAKELSFAEFIRDPRVAMACDNPITRHWFSIWDPKPLHPGNTAVRMACGMADSFAFLGVTEYMEESIRLFLRRFAPDFDLGRIDWSIPNQNRSQEGIFIGKEERDFLRKRNHCDQEIYRRVCAGLLKEFRRVG